jgi:molecular chaperone DnaK
LQGQDVGAIRHATDELSSALQRIGQAVYAAQGPSGSNGAGGADGQGQPQEEGTVEGEFREV